MTQISIPAQDFSFKECLRYLGRNDKECTHLVKDECLYKLVEIDGKLLTVKLWGDDHHLFIESDQFISVKEEAYLKLYFRQFFDLDRDLKPFYGLMEKDEIMAPIAQQYKGLRAVRMSDFFEAICWAILGQQINLNFAYQLKKQFAEKYGEQQRVEIKGEEHFIHLFPQPGVVAQLTAEELREIQFSRQKANYIIGVAQAIEEGRLEVTGLYQLPEEALKKELVALKGIGNWTANYLMMKVFGITTAFPIEDVGLHNALKVALTWERKPTLKEIEQMAQAWEGWEAYATFYLWHSLLPK